MGIDGKISTFPSIGHCYLPDDYFFNKLLQLGIGKL
jgi:hypothetical protein